MAEVEAANPAAAKPKREADRTNWAFWLSLVMFLISFMTQPDSRYDDDRVQTAYSVSLGTNCEADIKACRMRVNRPMGFRPETTRNEVVELDHSLDEAVVPRLYTGCVIWSAADWSCEDGKVVMSNGVIARNDLQTDPDIYYVPKIAWKLAKLHVLPLDSVRHSKEAAPKPKRSA